MTALDGTPRCDGCGEPGPLEEDCAGLFYYCRTCFADLRRWRDEETRRRRDEERSQAWHDIEHTVLTGLADCMDEAIERLPDECEGRPWLKLQARAVRPYGSRWDPTVGALALDDDADEEAILHALARRFKLALEWLPRESMWELPLKTQLRNLRGES